MNINKLLDELTTLLEMNEEYIYENYNDKKDQLLIDAKLVKKILKHIATYTSDTTQQNNLLKSILRKLFELQEKDLLIIKKGHVFIKYISMLEQNIPQGRENSNQARYNGFDEEELKAFYNEFCDEKELQTHIKSVAKEFVKKYIIKNRISSDEYEKKVFTIIKNLYFKFLTKKYEEKDEFLLGFAGYLFRNNFERTFLYIAEELLVHLAHNESQVIKFLEYYSQNIVILNAQKYKVPSIKTPEGQVWKVISMHSVIKVYVGAKEMITILNKKIKNLDKAIDNISNFSTSPVEQQKQLKNQIITLNNIINEKSHRVEKLQEAMRNTKKEKEKLKYKQEIRSLHKEITQLQNEKKEIEQKTPDEKIILKYQQLQREKETLIKELNNKKMILEKNEQQYKQLKYALVKALIQKKQKI